MPGTVMLPRWQSATRSVLMKALSHPTSLLLLQEVAFHEGDLRALLAFHHGPLRREQVLLHGQNYVVALTGHLVRWAQAQALLHYFERLHESHLPPRLMAAGTHLMEFVNSGAAFETCIATSRIFRRSSLPLPRCGKSST